MDESLSIAKGTRNRWMFEALFIALVVAGWMWFRGRDSNYDQQNAHVASLHWFLMRSRSNDLPIGDGIGVFLPAMWLLPWYAAIRVGQQWLADATLAAMSIVALLSLKRLARRIVSAESTGVDSPVGWLVLLVLSLTAGTLTEVGSTLGNLSTGALVLVGLDLGLSALQRQSTRLLSYSGFWLGLALGLKWTNAVFFVAIVAMTAVRFRRSFVRAFGAFGLTSLFGTIVTGGYVFYANWVRYRNPMFPYFNSVFQSTWWDTRSWSYAPYLMRNPLQMATFPFSYAVGTYRATELFMRDPRLLLAFLSSAFLVAAAIKRRQLFDDRLSLLALWWVISYVVWAIQFGIHRYLIVLELSGAILTLCAFGRVVRAVRKSPTIPSNYAIVGSVVVGLTALFVVVPNHGHTRWENAMPVRTKVDLPPTTLLVFSSGPGNSSATIQFDDRLERVGLAFGERSDVDVLNPRLSDRLTEETLRRVSDSSRPRVLVSRYASTFENDERLLLKLGLTLEECWKPVDAGVRLCHITGGNV